MDARRKNRTDRAAEAERVNMNAVLLDVFAMCGCQIVREGRSSVVQTREVVDGEGVCIAFV